MSEVPFERDPHAAERIANAVRALRREVPTVAGGEMTRDLAVAAADATVVDVDALRLAHLGEKLNLSDVTLLPVWENVLFGYRQRFALDEPDREPPGWYTNLTHFVAWESPTSERRWMAVISHYTVADNNPNVVKVFRGRLVLSLDADGAAVEIAEIGQDGGEIPDLGEDGRAEYDKRLFIPLFTLNLLNCRNVVVVSAPPRPRPAARRIARTGVTVSEIHIRPTGTTRTGRGDVKTIPADSMPLHSVRGHPAEYGINGKGLLFGRTAGRFWIPQFVRGRREHGVVDQSYVMEPGDD